jgi:hypothetical protein
MILNIGRVQGQMKAFLKYCLKPSTSKQGLAFGNSNGSELGYTSVIDMPSAVRVNNVA